MSSALKELCGSRVNFTGTIEDIRVREGDYGAYRQVMIKDLCVEESGEPVEEYIWITAGKPWSAALLENPKRVSFRASLQRNTGRGTGIYKFLRTDDVVVLE